ncbi:MAG: imidazole glycerol phosphate synthase subunit HisH [Bacteroidia bacterium]|nr:imidazole glycerol phosphate synthase subunit HisH [Bacteroidia bacterium]
MNIVVIKYNAGNIRSVDFALQRIGISATITDDKDEIRNADRVIFPGVGEAATTMQFLKQHKLDTLICDLKQPVLGVCLGLQLMCSHSEEGDTTCLGIFPEKVKKFVPQAGDLSHCKIPHMGWNSLSELKNPLFEGLSEADYFYFVHSYYATTGADTAATCTYLNPFSAALQRDNFYATQFHPEKSGSAGSKLLSNFINLKF